MTVESAFSGMADRTLLTEAELAVEVQEFRNALKPFGMEHRVEPEPYELRQLPDGRVWVELRTYAMVEWYPQKLKEMEAAGLEVMRYLRKWRTRPADPMYRVRWIKKVCPSQRIKSALPQTNQS